MPGTEKRKEVSPGGTIDSVALEDKSILLEKVLPLLSEIALTVRFALVSNVRLGFGKQRSTDAESRIAGLPFKPPTAEILIAPL